MSHLIKRNIYGDNFIKSNNIFLYTEQGKKIIDGCSNSMNVNLGYNIPEIEDAILMQIKKLNYMHTGKGGTLESEALADRLHDLVKKYGDYQVYLATSGSDCIEAALRIAVLYQKNTTGNDCNKFMSFEGCYHGSTLGALSITGNKSMRRNYEEYINNCTFIPVKRTSEKNFSFEKVTAIILDSMITNPIGSVMIDKNYLQELVQEAKNNHVITIIDEIATSVGRLGYMFGFEESGISPDIICISKGIGVGYANIGAVLVKKEVASKINGADILGHTFNASPIGCSIALAALDYIKENKIFDNVNTLSKYIYERLNNIKCNNYCVKKVSGKGFMWSVHFSNRVSANKIAKLCYKNGLLLLCLEQNDLNHITFAPPLISSKDQLELMCNIINKSMEEYFFV